MGVRTTLAGLSLTPAGAAKAESVGADFAGNLNLIENACGETIATLNYLINDILTPAGTEAANIATLQAAISALS